MKRKIAVAGYTGFIGSYIMPKLKDYGYEIKEIKKDHLIQRDVSKIVEAVNGCYAVINLSGVSINRRWTKRNKNLIWNSRINSTEMIVKAIEMSINRPEIFINASGVDIYPVKRTCTEECTEKNDSFLGHVINDWERKADEAGRFNIRIVKTRFGVVLGNHGSVFSLLRNVIKKLSGIVFGDGQQHMPVVHIEDVFRSIMFIIENNKLEGIFNVVAPEECRNIELIRKICEKFGRKVTLRINEKILKLFVGERSCLMLDDRIVIPKRLIDNGFRFKFKNINEIIDDLIVM